MRKSIRQEFGQQAPRAIVLDDSVRARKMTARKLRGRGFQVVECANSADFRQAWKPGTVDVIISDWDLTHNEHEEGDKILEEVRQRDWDVPFVLISGKLGQAGQRAGVLERLLDNGSARFVQRGDGGIQEACNVAEDLIERRDLALLKVILGLRPAAMEGVAIPTSSGEVLAERMLEELVSLPAKSHDAERPLAFARSKKLTGA
jgi:CheY-like chemotaxis protein